MTGAMYAAIAGLRAHMQNLNVIGNNVANVNTTAYKAARSVFRTSIYTTSAGGSNGTAVVGGTNPSQIGYGSNMANVDIDMSTGNYAVTGNTTDMMIDGDGFFMVGNKTVAGNFNGTAQNDAGVLTSLTLTRTGNFNFKADGYLTDGGGNVVYGFICIGKDEVTGKAIFSDQLVPIRFPKVYTDKNDVVQVGYARPGGGVADDDKLAAGNNAGGGNAGGGDPVDGDKHIMDYGTTSLEEESEYSDASFTNITVDNKTGVITATCGDRDNEVVTIGRIAIATVTNPNGVTQIGDTYYKAQEGAGEMHVTALGGTSNLMGADGRITHINGSLAPKDNNNPDAGNDAAAASPQDPLRIRTSESELLTGGLEMSKTDLAQEISNMILTQRGYQANTRIITVTDSMLEELVNMKR